jgi:MATE family multidrug resistance protein
MAGLDISRVKTEIKHNVRLSIPLIASQLLYSFSGFIGTAMLARLGQDVLAASVLSSMIWFSLSAVFFGVLNAVSVLVSHQYGSKNDRGVSEVIGQGFILAILTTALISLVLFVAPFFLQFTGQSATILELATRYIHAIQFGVLPLSLVVVIEHFLIGLGKTSVVLFASLILVPLQIVFNYIFIYGFWFVPACGIAGVGYGLAFATLVEVVGFLFYLHGSKQFEKYEVFKRIGIHWRYLKELVRVGLPIGFMSCIEIGAFAIMTFAVARFGVTQLAAHQITFQFAGLLITVVFAMSQAVTVRVGHAVGEGNRSQVDYSIGVGMLITICVMLFLSAIMLIFPHWLIHFDVDIHAPKNQLLVAQATSYFRVLAFLFLFDTFRIIGFGALRGIKDTRFPMLASFVAFWLVGLGLSYLLGFVFDLQSVGIWLGMTLGISVGAVIICWRLFFQLKHLDMVKVAKF